MINLDEILNSIYSETVFKSEYSESTEMYSEKSVKNAIREAIRQALELAANEATVDYNENINAYNVNKQSILNIINKVV